MSDPKDNPEGEHIEELLSQLKGIFGHLSDTEKEESKQKVTPPSASTPPAPSAPPVDSTPTSSTPFTTEAEFSDPATSQEPLALDPTMIPFEIPDRAVPTTEAVAEPPTIPDYVPAEINIPEGASLIPAAVFYPAGRLNEAKIVTDKIEKITPKFTKVAVVIHIESLVAYDVKADVKAAILNSLNPAIRAVFLLIDKPLDDVRRKDLISQLEPKGVYFQEIPFHQIEKKALYTDMLLGMVFFFDSQKKPGEGIQ